MNLEVISGIPLYLDKQYNLQVCAPLIVEESKNRMLNELNEVYLDRQVCQSNQLAYQMFNGVRLEEDAGRFRDLPIRYELTFFPGLKVGREYVKTLGHIHDPEPDSMVDYPEICEVLLGTAHFLLQKLDPGGPFARDVFYVVVKTGEKIIIPPGYDHLTINPGPGPMLFSDVIARAVSTNYTKMKKSGGGAYLEVEENGQPCFIPNPRYRQATPLRQARPLSFPELYLTPGQPLYQTFRETCGSSWPFLWEPGRFNKLFPELESLFVFD